MSGPEPCTLGVDELVLRPWRTEDEVAVWALAADPALRQWNARGFGSREEVREMVARLADWSGGDRASWAVTDAVGTLLGSVSLHSVDRVQGDAQLGYWVAPAARGRRVAARAADAVCRWAFDAGIDRVELYHAVENEASGRVAARAGFTREGRLRRSYRYGDGVKHDEFIWSRLSDDPPPALR
ncbi:GNAT family N-acetyltransferase [Modestobacter italicus]|uniref:GNAT family N-acetyltransferase n=1 Tax=Modestobacter italicus (strain DSM 44449 / CECT 9708 / BC 501) TaxID=2732864 RepID=UPI0027E16DA1|nr:GNAT family N-acetyltransferase [Modestobacter italicus]